MSTDILFGLRFDLSENFWNAQAIVTPFLSFNGINQAYLLKISITNNKKLNPLLSLLIDCVSAKPALQILSLNTE